MNLDDLNAQIQSVGLHPIRVESVLDRSGDLRFVGSLAEYLQAVKAVKSSFLLVSTVVLSEDHFFYSESDQDDDDPDPEEEVDMCTVLSTLSVFKERIGEVGHFDLSAPMASTSLTFAIIEDWWREFVEQHSAANSIIREERDAELAKLDAAEVEKTHLVTEQLRALIDDKRFTSLPTQRAMREYALEKLPELDMLDPQDIKREIQDLSARIHAKGIGHR